MAKIYYSTTFAQTADKVWAVIRDFNGFQWAEGVGKSHIENRKDNNQVGAIRDFKYYDHVTRERLVAPFRCGEILQLRVSRACGDASFL
jgi:hypothetical protein